MKSLVASKLTPVSVDGVREAEQTKADAAAARHGLGASGPLVSFARFVLFGGGVGVASSVAVAVLQD